MVVWFSYQRLVVFHSIYIVFLNLQLFKVLKLKSELWPFILQAEAEDKEEFYDVVEGELERGSEGEGKNEDTSMEEGNVIAERDKYSMIHREPLYCGAEKSCLWELDRVINNIYIDVELYVWSLQYCSLNEQ